jgi:hypothetical protein
MTTWKKYANSDGHYCEIHGMVMTAWPNGSWSVHDTLGNLGSRSSTLAPIITPKANLETAKQAAEAALNAMLDG